MTTDTRSCLYMPSRLRLQPASVATAQLNPEPLLDWFGQQLVRESTRRLSEGQDPIAQVLGKSRQRRMQSTKTRQPHRLPDRRVSYASRLEVIPQPLQKIQTLGFRPSSQPRTR